MGRREFAQEFGGILLLLREHSFLAYSKSGRAEYDAKVRTAVDHFAHLVFRMTGISVCPLHDLIPIESARQPSFEEGRRLALRSASAARRSAASAVGPERERLAECAARWNEAAARLEGPQGD